jgi:hypothetical protein
MSRLAHAKFGYDGGYFAQTRRNGTGNTRWSIVRHAHGGLLQRRDAAASTCGNTSLYYPSDPFNQATPARAYAVNINTGKAAIENRVG